jgi:asparagine synthase (glutamine-hydrolysing)
VRTAWLDELLDGRRAAQPSTVAFLVNLLVATEPVSTSPGLVNNVQPLS